MLMTVTFELTILYLVAINLIAVLGYVLYYKYRARRTDENVAKLMEAIAAYFKKSNTMVRAECVPRADGKRFVATIDSEPSKRFRHSHVVEIGLRLFVLKSCGLELERVYWRFHAKAQREGYSDDEDIGEAGESANDGDLYLSESEILMKARSEYEVYEIPWEKYQRQLQADALA